MMIIDVWYLVVEKVLSFTEVKNISWIDLKKVVGKYIEKIQI